MKDPIFTLAEPYENGNQPENQNPNCNCCGDKYKSTKDIRSCQFCSIISCSRCCYKSRAFPNGDGESEGDICKVCDSKFFIKQWLKNKQDTVELQNNQIVGEQGLKTQIEKSKQRLRAVNREFKKTKDMYRVDFQKVKIMLNRFKNKIEDLEVEEKRRIKENDELVDKKEMTNKEMTQV
mmetsp:Transcript_32682/g.49949  ORF Transcript_32682/g.49949 Transcript_32682/m.49949 type:complete len:179 (+) Transcript_32682:460-996(+)